MMSPESRPILSEIPVDSKISSCYLNLRKSKFIVRIAKTYKLGHKGGLIMPVAERKTKHPYISIDPKISGGQPVITDTRIKVMDIAIRYELMGWSADKIVDEYPHLKLEQVHDALSYYYEHKNEIDKRWRDAIKDSEVLKRIYPSVLEKKIESYNAL